MKKMKLFDFSCKPDMAWLNVNRQCNLRCKWCYAEGTGYAVDESMTLEMAQFLVPVCDEMGIKHINFIGGEPTLWPYLSQVIELCRKRNIVTGLITNGLKFSDDEYWNEYKKMPCDKISLSIKSMDETEFSDVTGTMVFKSAIKGIERAIKFHQSGVTTVYNNLVGLDGLKKIAESCRTLGATSIIVNMCSPSVNNGMVDDSYMVDYVQLSKDIMEMYPFLNELYDGKVELDIQMPLCVFPESFIDTALAKHQIMTICQVFSRSAVNFAPNGDVMVCNELYDTIIVKKNEDYHDAISLKERLNCDGLKEDYRQILRYPSDECEKCRLKNVCRGGCLLNWMVYDPKMCHAVH